MKEIKKLELSSFSPFFSLPSGTQSDCYLLVNALALNPSLDKLANYEMKLASRFDQLNFKSMMNFIRWIVSLIIGH